MQPSYALLEQLISLHLASSNQCTIMNHYILRLWSSFALSSLAANPIYKSTSSAIPWDPMHQSGLLKFSHYGLHLQVQPNLRRITQNRIAQVIHICINLASMSTLSVIFHQETTLASTDSSAYIKSFPIGGSRGFLERGIGWVGWCLWWSSDNSPFCY